MNDLTGSTDRTLSRPSGPFTVHARVLVVDPDEQTRAVYRESLTATGCDVVEASDGRDALAKAFVRPPALVVTEVALPFIDGYALCEILRRDRLTASVPILVVTAEARERSQTCATCVSLPVRLFATVRTLALTRR
jgi:CheY-like chemotaxis protein